MHGRRCSQNSIDGRAAGLFFEDDYDDESDREQFRGELALLRKIEELGRQNEELVEGIGDLQSEEQQATLSLQVLEGLWDQKHGQPFSGILQINYFLRLLKWN